jgi:hypothetical protein
MFFPPTSHVNSRQAELATFPQHPAILLFGLRWPSPQFFLILLRFAFHARDPIGGHEVQTKKMGNGQKLNTGVETLYACGRLH